MTLVKRLRYNFCEKRKILNHSFFRNMVEWRTIHIKQINIQHKAKRAMFTRFLTIKFEIFEREFIDFLSSPDCLDNIDELVQITARCIELYEAEAKSIGVPTIFFDKFTDWHADTINATIKNMGEIINSNAHTSPYSKLIAVLDILNYAFRMTILCAEKTLDSFNGDLENALRGSVFDI